MRDRNVRHRAFLFQHLEHDWRIEGCGMTIRDIIIWKGIALTPIQPEPPRCPGHRIRGARLRHP